MNCLMHGIQKYPKKAESFVECKYDCTHHIHKDKLEQHYRECTSYFNLYGQKLAEELEAKRTQDSQHSATNR